MWNKLSGLYNQYFFWTKNGLVPPTSVGTPQEDADRNMNHFRSKKFTVIFMSFVVILFFYFSGVAILFWLRPDTVAAFVTMFSKILEVIAWIVTFWCTGQSVIDLKYSNSTNVDLIGQNSTNTQNLNQNINENITEVKRIIREGEAGAPEIRPFAMIATEE